MTIIYNVNVARVFAFAIKFTSVVDIRKRGGDNIMLNTTFLPRVEFAVTKKGDGLDYWYGTQHIIMTKLDHKLIEDSGY